MYIHMYVLNESLWCHFNQPIHMEIRLKAIHKRNLMAAAGISIIDCAINAERVRNGRLLTVKPALCPNAQKGICAISCRPW